MLLSRMLRPLACDFQLPKKMYGNDDDGVFHVTINYNHDSFGDGDGDGDGL